MGYGLQIESLHVELTTKCNASCPMCPRNIQGSEINPNLYHSELSLNFFQTKFTKDFLFGLKDIFFCGNYGDPAVAKDIVQIFSYLRDLNSNLYLHMHTNGSMHNSEWWSNLGKIIGKNGNISFGLDGLEDTLSIYRVGCNYEKVINNAKAFIGAGGEARWNFYVFAHNEHQVEEAMQRAKKLGFKRFMAKKTGRFFDQKTLKKLDRFAVFDSNKNIKYYLEPPKNFIHRNSHVDAVDILAKKYGSILNYLDQTPITCQEMERRRIFISAQGWVLPCGYLNHQLFDHELLYSSTSNEVSALINYNEINLHAHSLEIILQSETFQKIQETWQKKSLKEGKLRVCALTCGKEFDKIRAQTEKTIGFSLKNPIAQNNDVLAT